MTFVETVRAFARDDRGAITIDWTVLTAAIVLMTIGIFPLLSGAIDSVIGAITWEMVYTNLEAKIEN